MQLPDGPSSPATHASSSWLCSVPYSSPPLSGTVLPLIAPLFICVRTCESSDNGQLVGETSSGRGRWTFSGSALRARFADDGLSGEPEKLPSMPYASPADHGQDSWCEVATEEQYLDGSIYQSLHCLLDTDSFALLATQTTPTMFRKGSIVS
jgi:hypothetical protein